ncbi:putative E3 ubiquitin-protein ligase [Recurvomyces mirabilis]|uniref:HECT-type E3 ubiquitin transferase n=1 Tax=Recurvomyces mirabilis TaxID=574656 RepID=A0AAE0TNA3_9PEZI|nr:putative E3 ubiquitin-protein ligase [Recurvomyces mirabilis]KAK5153082.1 putative E3 ubiquitin-protein ligase [Recurvomyces mirabilis]
MAPSWSTRLLSGGSSSSSSQSRNNTAESPRTNKPLPRQPPLQSIAFDPPPTLHHERAQATPPRPQTSGGARQHQHNRSVSHPLPKIFSRKKSGRDLAGGYNNTDVPLGSNDLVPVLAEPAAVPSRVISGKRGGKPEDENKITRNCMCCDSRLSVPKELEKFRCQVCTTVNDIKPVAEQKDGRPELEKQTGAFPHGIKGPLSVERTRAIVDKCVVTYLEARCRRQEQNGPNAAQRAASASARPPVKHAATDPIPIKMRDGKQLIDAPLSSSPPDEAKVDEVVHHSATITDVRELDPFALMPADPPLTQPEPLPASTITQPMPARPTRRPPPAPINLGQQRSQSHSLQPNHGSPNQSGALSPRLPLSPRMPSAEMKARERYERARMIFRPLEDYIVAAFGDFHLLNGSFSTTRPVIQGRTRSESSIKSSAPAPEPTVSRPAEILDEFSEFDAKTLLLGDLGENSSWWVGKLDRMKSDKATKRKKVPDGTRRPINSKSPNINWAEVDKWYAIVQSAGEDWRAKITQIKSDEPDFTLANVQGFNNIEDINDDLEEARQHAIRTLFKVTENVLKRPTQPLKEAEHLRFLLIILANPLLYPSSRRPMRSVSGGSMLRPNRAASDRRNGAPPESGQPASPRRSLSTASGPQHTGILKRVFGLLANSSESCHRYLIGWFSRYDQPHFEKVVELVASFVTHRITRRPGRPRSKSGIDDGGLIPDLSGSAANTSAQLHSAMGLSGSVKKQPDNANGETEWANDWQIKAAAKLMSLLFAANNVWQGKRRESNSSRSDSGVMLGSGSPAAKATRSGQLMHTSQFYNLMLDYHDLIVDFKVWESRRDKFAFCQYPLFLSMGTKIKILEYDARRQMEIKAREAYFDSVIRQRALEQYLHLRVRRDCMVDDSLRQISEAVGQGSEELKKGLRIQFVGEDGVDAGGLRKEWFLMLIRDIFDPNHGMFVYDDDSHTCYFNANSFETSDQYHLVGALLGLAIYNSTILDVALPPFAFRKLLAAAPSSSANGNVSSITGTKGQMTYTVADLAEFRPSLAAGLQQLLDFDGDVETTYCWNFVAPVDRYGVVAEVPLIPNGEGTPVTNANRHEFVEAYIRYLLDTSVTRQFEPFKRGFFTVCAGNALSLFRAEEIELLVRGSDEQLDVDSLRAVAVYENWKHHHEPHTILPNPSETVPIIAWFWELFAQADPAKQRSLLTFITGSDRIPAVGATSLVLRIVAGGDGWGGGGEEERQRFPVARTCFNMLVLWRYDTKEALEYKLWRAVEESEGFGLK